MHKHADQARHTPVVPSSMASNLLPLTQEVHRVGDSLNASLFSV